MAELPQTSPALLMLQVMPCTSGSFWKYSLVYWLLLSERCSDTTGLPRRHTVIMSASTTSCNVMPHAWPRPRSRRSLSDEVSAMRLWAHRRTRAVCAAHRTYDARRVWHELLEQSQARGLHPIERLMRE